MNDQIDLILYLSIAISIVSFLFAAWLNHWVKTRPSRMNASARSPAHKKGRFYF
jgi:hypothetical protein